jgi:hypothetical protein
MFYKFLKIGAKNKKTFRPKSWDERKLFRDTTQIDRKIGPLKASLRDVTSGSNNQKAFFRLLRGVFLCRSVPHSQHQRLSEISVRQILFSS